ncbi:MAG: hypothetical protein JKY37_34670 [Nannocystaceae bacterium]|nr:hypothetical protein [Nannocystaceae bacterium]
MRLPLRHPPPRVDADPRQCAHLDALADALVGVPLGPAAAFTSSVRSRGRHGNALQWHLGLRAHDNDGVPDWEGRIEIKLVSVWRRANGEVTSDKLKVCDIGVDPWSKLSNVLWVFADRLTRVVVGCRSWCLSGEARVSLEASWEADPHFDEPALFVEAREQGGGGSQPVKRAPAYYLAARWLSQVGLLPDPKGVFAFDAIWARDVRAEHGRDPVAHVLTVHNPGAPHRCRRCGGPVNYLADRLREFGWAPARHGMPHGGDCAVRGHFVVSPASLLAPISLPAPHLLEILERREPEGQIWRLCDHVQEPDDHLH